ncbi:MAG TPA: ABC transporter permease subunit [Polyangia bacterium]|nr:ABC transporter permease subunit [Polyangia bacterium]
MGSAPGPNTNIGRAAALLPWVVPLALLIAWAAAGGQRPERAALLPAPAAVVSAAFRLIDNGELAHHVRVSLGRALLGLAIGGGAGLALGLLNGCWPVAEGLLDTPVQMARNVPHLALIPLVILWFGLGEPSKIFLVALGVLFPIYLNTFHGVRAIDPGLIEMARLYGLRGWPLFWQVVFPGALPAILVGLRFALGVMWLSLIVAETIATDAGIGYLAMSAREFMQTDVVVLSVLLYAALGKLADSAARLLESRFVGWEPRRLRKAAVAS